MKKMVAVAVAVCTIALLGRGAGAQGPVAPVPHEPPPLAKGDTVPPFDAEGVDGTANHVDYPKGSTTVLMFFLSSCPTCHRMIPLWNSAYERKAKGLRVFAVMLDQESPGFFMATQISFPVLRAPGGTPAERKAFTDKFKVRRVPVTARVGAGGKVEDVGLGALDAIRVGQLFAPPS